MSSFSYLFMLLCKDKMLWTTAAILRPQNNKPEGKSHKIGNGRVERKILDYIDLVAD